MYWWMVAFAAFLPILLLFGPMCYWLKGEEPIGLGTINPLVSKNFMAFTDRIAQWMTELMGEKPSEDSTTYWLVGIFLVSFPSIKISG